ncbi:hypothetical protein M2145_001114, partial [Lachnospiraceae bacterium PF1-21]
YHARCGAGEKPEVATPEAYLSLFKMPAAFEKILATCRSRDIYCAILLQSLAQLKVAYREDKWEGVYGNCDTVVFLGGNEPSSHKHMSEQAGEKTIEKRSQGESKGGHGSSNANYDVMGRRLILPEEVSMLKDECLVRIKGEYSVKDKKWDYYGKHKKIREKVMSFGKYNQDVWIEREDNRLVTKELYEGFTPLNDKSREYYEACKRDGEKLEIYQMSRASFLSFDFSKSKSETEAQMLLFLKSAYEEKGKKKPIEKAEQRKISGIASAEELLEYVISGAFNQEQMEVLSEITLKDVPLKQLKRIARPELPAENMRFALNLITKMEEVK